MSPQYYHRLWKHQRTLRTQWKLKLLKTDQFLMIEVFLSNDYYKEIMCQYSLPYFDHQTRCPIKTEARFCNFFLLICASVLYEIANQVIYFLMLSLDYSFLHEPRSQINEVNHIRTCRGLQMIELSLQVSSNLGVAGKEA